MLKKYFKSNIPEKYLNPIAKDYNNLQKAYHSYDVINLGIAAGLYVN